MLSNWAAKSFGKEIENLISQTAYNLVFLCLSQRYVIAHFSLQLLPKKNRNYNYNYNYFQKKILITITITITSKNCNYNYNYNYVIIT